MKRNQKGITLIALIVTIIVLLILAAIAISLLAGDNGIITRTIQAREEHCIGADREAINLSLMAVKSDMIAITSNKIGEELKNSYNREAKITDKETGKCEIVILKCGHTFMVDYENGIIEYTRKEDGKEENKIVISANPSQSTNADYKYQIEIKVTSELEEISQKSLKVFCTKENTDQVPEELKNGKELTSESTNSKTLNSETVIEESESGDYYLWVSATVNGKEEIQKFGPYNVIGRPTKEDIIFNPSTEDPTTSIDITINTTKEFPKYTLQYQIGDTVNPNSWENYDEKITLTENETIWARLYNEEENHEVVNSIYIDKICSHNGTWTTVDSEKCKCDKCGYMDAHQNNDTYTCIRCGYKHIHNFIYTSDMTEGEYHQCTICGCKEEHKWNPGINGKHQCSVCNLEKDHEYDINYGGNTTTHCCKICNQIDEHEFVPYDENYHICGICKNEETHIWEEDSDTGKHKCQLCGMTEEHTFDSTGNCMKCGYECRHEMGFTSVDYQNHICTICNMSEPHEFDSSGNCMKCNTTCNHSWSDRTLYDMWIYL